MDPARGDTAPSAEWAKAVWVIRNSDLALRERPRTVVDDVGQEPPLQIQQLTLNVLV
jgi:hypothetical protein